MQHDFTPLSVFGWKMLRKTIASGDTFVIDLPSDLKTSMIDTCTFWVCGSATGVHSDSTQPNVELTTGFFTKTDLPTITLAGQLNFTVNEDSEWWCINAVQNGGKLPNLVPLRLNAGETITLNTNDRVLLCAGTGTVDGVQVAAGCSLTITTKRTLIADTNMYGLFFS